MQGSYVDWKGLCRILGVVCDLIENDAYHLILGMPSQYDCDIIYKGKANTFSFDWHGREVMPMPISTKATKQKVLGTSQALWAISGTKLN